MTDNFIEHPERLRGKPKETIGDLIDHETDIAVPKRFKSLDEALQTNTPVLVRSEHPQAYHHMRGMLESKKLSFIQRTIGNALDKQTVRKKMYDDVTINLYCEATEQDKKAFLNNVSYSLWEYIDGNNHTVVADTALPNKHHVVTHGNDGCYAVVENDELNVIAGQAEDSQQDQQVNNLYELVKEYEKIRRLPQFDNANCPIMEFASTDERQYFLQYYHGHRFTPAQFTLNDTPRSDEVRADFVRGATNSARGELYTVAVEKPRWTTSLTNELDGFSRYVQEGNLYARAVAQEWKAFIRGTNPEDLLRDSFKQGTHTALDVLHAPELAVISKDWFTRAEVSHWKEEYGEQRNAKQTSQDKTPLVVDARIRSDGRRAYLTRESQPYLMNNP